MGEQSQRSQPCALDGAAVLTAPIMQYGGRPFRVTRSLDAGYLQMTANDKGAIWTFSLSQHTGYAQFTALFAEYRIVATELDIVWTPNQASAVQSGPTPVVYFATDPFASAAPSSLAGMLAKNYQAYAFSADKNSLTIRVPSRVADSSLATPGSYLAAVPTHLASKAAWYASATPTMTYGALLAWFGNFCTAGGCVGSLKFTQRMTLEFRGTQG